MLDLDCPWCEGSMAVDDDRSQVECDACGVRVELAADPVVERAALAA
jgi:primosomal protein N'